MPLHSVEPQPAASSAFPTPPSHAPNGHAPNGHGAGSLPGIPMMGRLGERLLQAGRITPQQLQQALEVQSRSGLFLGQVLVDLGCMTAVEMGTLLARDCGVPYVDLLSRRPDPEALALVPEHVIRQDQALPLALVGEELELAMVDPLDVSALDRIQNLTGKRIRPFLSMAWEMQRTVDDCFDAYSRASEALQQLEAEDESQPDDARSRRARADLVVASEAPIVRLVDSILEGAVAARASDIHFEPHEEGLRVRFRVDGVLLEQAEIPRNQQAAVVARMKVLSVMDITESRRPQDGRMRYLHHNRAFDLRVSSVPTVFGEKLVLRILDKSSVLVPLGRLGFLPGQQRRFEGMIQQPHGMVVVVGPTGSGKSTTLYSSLNLLNDSTRNIMTLEDPVEYNIRGLNQIQVNPRINLTFASGLRAFVRQDPDVILVGEIRDRETAEMAVQASLTGHLVLSTLHTNSAVGTIARFTNLGVDPFLIAQALTGIVSQRLVGKICQHCDVNYQPSPELLSAVGITPEEARKIEFRRGQGCSTCRGRGYLGRCGLYEVLVVSEEFRRLIMRGAPEIELQAAAQHEGMQSLRECALSSVRAGVTTLEEMGRVVLTGEVGGGH
ncbi:MAG: GspE/PulE family protein [Armatimonadota bacterium]